MNNNDNNYINPKTGSGYVSSSDNNMDASIGFVLIAIVVIIVGGIFLIFNNDDVKDIFLGELEDIVETIGEIFEEDYDEEYYDEDNLDDTYYDEDIDDDNGDVPSVPATTYNIDEFTVIKPSNIAVLSDRNDKIVVWIGRQHYISSVMQSVEIKKIIENYNVPVYHIETTGILSVGLNPTIYNQFEYNMLSYLSGDGIYNDYMKDYYTTGRPITLVISNNRIIEAFDGYTEAKDIEVALDRHGITRK